MERERRTVRKEAFLEKTVSSHTVTQHYVEFGPLGFRDGLRGQSKEAHWVTLFIATFLTIL